MIELRRQSIAGVRDCDIEGMKKIVFTAFGPDPNLANIDVTTILDIKARRVGQGTAGPLRA